MPAVPGAVAVRAAGEADLDAVVEFEIEIAKVSFGEGAITDPAVHRRRIVKAIGNGEDGMFVACAPGGAAIGWAWVSLKRNFLTGERYANFRSLAVRPAAEGSSASEALMEAVLQFAARQGAEEVVGKVHVANTKMRALYRRFGFEAEHLTMRRRR